MMKMIVYRGILRLVTVCLLIFTLVYACNIIVGKGKAFDPSTDSNKMSGFFLEGKVYGVIKKGKDKTKYLLEGATVTLYDKDYIELSSVTTGEDGGYSFFLTKSSTFVVIAKMEKHESIRILASTTNHPGGAKAMFDFELYTIETQHQYLVNMYLEKLVSGIATEMIVEKDMNKGGGLAPAILQSRGLSDKGYESASNQNKQQADQYTDEDPATDYLTKEENVIVEPDITLRVVTVDKSAVIFKVQLGQYSKQVQPGCYKGLKGVNCAKEDIFFVYSIGEFQDIRAARKARSEVIAKGFADAYIKAYVKGEPVKMKVALGIE